MAFRLVHAKYDRQTRRAYVEFRDIDDDGGETVATATFSFRTLKPLHQRQIEEEVLRKARHLLRRAAAFRAKGDHGRFVN